MATGGKEVNQRQTFMFLVGDTALPIVVVGLRVCTHAVKVSYVLLGK
jgi:hypothetical protein